MNSTYKTQTTEVDRQRFYEYHYDSFNVTNNWTKGQSYQCHQVESQLKTAYRYLKILLKHNMSAWDINYCT